MTSTQSLKTVLSGYTMPAAPALVRDEDNQAVRCVACAHRCLIPNGRSGVCRVRFNDGGRLRVPAGYVAGLQIDPIEKKPFFHAWPASNALSFGMLGCNFHCSYCQNWISSQSLRDDRAAAAPRACAADEVARLAVEHTVPVVVSTYNEPLITCDWAVEVFKRARAHDIVCGFVSNGHATPEALEFIRPYVDLYKVDLKSFRDRNYRKLGGVLQPVLDTIRHLHAMAFWVEVVTLVVPTFNDSDDELREMADFIASVSPDIPWHCTAFHPDYKMADLSATPAETLDRAHAIGRAAGLRFVYAGNLPGRVGERENTACPGCDGTLIRRQGFRVLENRLRRGRCPDCATAIPGRWPDATIPASAPAPT
ncbi:MAG: AmmeMemoRadiSam system radical SAM enzyme [Phycisphaerae bacterium]|nr:AmmeMemoRadiSam system radical SAM enzyme [Phycisphaerae bacterium]